MQRNPLGSLGAFVLTFLVLAGARPAGAVTTNIFSTQFETAGGYSTAFDLIGQQGWIGSGSGGNGLVGNFIAGEGQQAYIGFDPPNAGEDQLVVWRPVNFSPIPTNMPVINFSALMCVVDSTTNHYDDFYFSVFNAHDQRLFTIDFDNNDYGIKYLLDGAGSFVPSGKFFANDDVYALVVRMDFASNRWNAMLEGVPVITNQPITTTGATLDLGEIAAGWLVRNATNPGDNFLLFDNYQITAEVQPPPPPQLRILSRTNGQTLLRVLGQSNTRFSIDATTNLSQWTALKTNPVTGGFFDYVDSSASALARRFYQARWVP